MENKKKSYADTLQRLVSICNDGKENYLNAAKHTHNSQLRPLFEKYAGQRQKFIEELKQQISNLGHNTENEHGGPVGALHDLWMNIRTSITNTKEDDKSILRAVRESEQSALESYDDELQGDILETDLKAVLANQRTEISIAFQEMDGLYFDQFPPTDNEL